MRNAFTLRSSVNGYVPSSRSTPRELTRHVASLALDDGRVGRVRAFVDRGRDAGHRGQVIAAVLAFDVRRQRAAHGEPHDDFGALEAAELGVFGDGHRGQLLRIALEEIEEARCPTRDC